MKTLLFVFLALASMLRAQETPELNQQNIRTAASWLSSAEASRRKAAISTFRTMPAAAMPQYKIALEAALKANLERIKQADHGKNSLTEHDDIARQLVDERKRVMEMVQTDYHKDSNKERILRQEMDGLIELFTKRNKNVKSDISPLVNAVQSSIDGLCEITRELEKLDPQLDTRKLNDAELRAQLTKDSLEADHVSQMLASWNNTKSEIERLTEVEKLNAENTKWCGPSMKSFATILNHERVAIGLNPLRIEEKLSEAAAGHSSDMASIGFFDHESPVPNKKTPWDRARLAKFDGIATGENIFMGSAEAQSAYDAWYTSDGHRFNMFADGPNCCGIGIAGIHWTFMTGNKNGW